MSGKPDELMDVFAKAAKDSGPWGLMRVHLSAVQLRLAHSLRANHETAGRFHKVAGALETAIWRADGRPCDWSAQSLMHLAGLEAGTDDLRFAALNALNEASEVHARASAEDAGEEERAAFAVEFISDERFARLASEIAAVVSMAEALSARRKGT